MRITRLQLRGLQRHDDLEVRPAPGITVLRGPNESGKSTVRRAIELALYGRTDADAQLRRWGLPERTPAAVELDVEADGGEETSFRVIRRVGGDGHLELQLADGTLEGEMAERRLAELTGIPSLACFRSTAVIDHADLAGLGRDDEALTERLHATVSAGDRAFARSLRALEAQLDAIDGTGLGAPGPLAAAEADVERLEVELERGEDGIGRQLADQEALWSAQTELAEAEAQLEGDRELLSTSEEAVRLLIEQQEADAEHARFQRAVVVRDDIEKLDRSHPASLPLGVLREGAKRLRDLEATIAELTAELADEVTVSGDLMRPAPHWRLFTLIGVVFAAAGVAVAAFTPEPIVGAVVGIAGVLSAFVGRRRRRLAFDPGYQKSLREEQVNRRLRGRSAIEERLRHAEKAREAQLAGLGVADLAAAEKVLAAEEDHVAQLETLRAEFVRLQGEPPVTEDVAVLRDRAAAEGELRRHLLAQMGEIGRDPEGQRARYEAAVTAGEAARSAAREAAAAARARVDAELVDADEVAAIAESLAEATLRRERLMRRRRILEGTLAALRAADAATMQECARFVERRIERDIDRITDGRYRRVQVDDGDLSIRVWSPERGDWVDVRALSDATLGQVYVAARLALARQVTGGIRPPLVLDDPFATFDDVRAARALDLLRSLAAEHQVLYLAASSRYDAVADQVVELAAPVALDVEPPVAEAV